MPEDLKPAPCPFCGGQAEGPEWNDTTERGWEVWCPGCDEIRVCAFGADRREAVENWNRRAPERSAEPEALADRYIESLERISAKMRASFVDFCENVPRPAAPSAEPDDALLCSRDGKAVICKACGQAFTLDEYDHPLVAGKMHVCPGEPIPFGAPPAEEPEAPTALRFPNGGEIAVGDDGDADRIRSSVPPPERDPWRAQTQHMADVLTAALRRPAPAPPEGEGPRVMREVTPQDLAGWLSVEPGEKGVRVREDGTVWMVGLTQNRDGSVTIGDKVTLGGPQAMVRLHGSAPAAPGEGEGGVEARAESTEASEYADTLWFKIEPTLGMRLRGIDSRMEMIEREQRRQRQREQYAGSTYKCDGDDPQSVMSAMLSEQEGRANKGLFTGGSAVLDAMLRGECGESSRQAVLERDDGPALAARLRDLEAQVQRCWERVMHNYHEDVAWKQDADKRMDGIVSHAERQREMAMDEVVRRAHLASRVEALEKRLAVTDEEARNLALSCGLLIGERHAELDARISELERKAGEAKA